jgi:hypothetical protein
VLEQRATDSQPPSVRHVNNERTDLGSPLFLVDNVNDSCRLSVTLGDEHILPRGKLTDVVNAACDVRIKDTPCVRTVVPVVERSERPDHKLRDEIEVVRSCGAHNDVAD